MNPSLKNCPGLEVSEKGEITIKEIPHVVTIEGDLLPKFEPEAIWIDEEGFFRRRYLVRLKFLGWDEDWHWQFSYWKKSDALAARDFLIAQFGFGKTRSIG